MTDQGLAKQCKAKSLLALQPPQIRLDYRPAENLQDIGSVIIADVFASMSVFLDIVVAKRMFSLGGRDQASVVADDLPF